MQSFHHKVKPRDVYITRCGSICLCVLFLICIPPLYSIFTLKNPSDDDHSIENKETDNDDHSSSFPRSFHILFRSRYWLFVACRFYESYRSLHLLMLSIVSEFITYCFCIFITMLCIGYNREQTIGQFITTTDTYTRHTSFRNSSSISRCVRITRKYLSFFPLRFIVLFVICLIAFQVSENQDHVSNGYATTTNPTQPSSSLHANARNQTLLPPKGASQSGDLQDIDFMHKNIETEEYTFTDLSTSSTSTVVWYILSAIMNACSDLGRTLLRLMNEGINRCVNGLDGALGFISGFPKYGSSSSSSSTSSSSPRQPHFQQTNNEYSLFMMDWFVNYYESYFVSPSSSTPHQKIEWTSMNTSHIHLGDLWSYLLSLAYDWSQIMVFIVRKGMSSTHPINQVLWILLNLILCISLQISWIHTSRVWTTSYFVLNVVGCIFQSKETLVWWFYIWLSYHGIRFLIQYLLPFGNHTPNWKHLFLRYYEQVEYQNIIRYLKTSSSSPSSSSQHSPSPEQPGGDKSTIREQ